MRLRMLGVVLLVSGCRQSPPEPPIVLELPANAQPAPDTKPTGAEAPDGKPARAEASGTAQAAPAEELPDLTWSARSENGRAEVRQTASRTGKELGCSIVSTVKSLLDGQNVVWQWDTCIATREQLKYVSPDGKRVIVLEPLPESLQGKGNWKDVEVATLYEHGLRVTGMTAGAFVGTPEWAQAPSIHFAWAKGQGGLPGEPPHYTFSGTEIELESADGRSFRLGFDGEGFPAPSHEPIAPTTVMHRYVDDQGTSHFVGSTREIPERYRSRAVAVKAEVGVLPASSPSAGGESQPSKPESETPVAAGAGKPEELKELLRSKGLDPESKNPAQMLKKLQEDVKKIEDAQRKREQLETAP
jgi:hypothetical protein